MAFETMAVLYVEVEPARWEGGRFSFCNTVLMTGIHWQCQVQVETWQTCRGGWEAGILHLLITPGGLIQSSSVMC